MSNKIELKRENRLGTRLGGLNGAPVILAMIKSTLTSTYHLQRATQTAAIAALFMIWYSIRAYRSPLYLDPDNLLLSAGDMPRNHYPSISMMYKTLPIPVQNI